MFLTKRGKIIQYAIQLERQFDTSQLVRPGSNDQNPTEDEGMNSAERSEPATNDTTEEPRPPSNEAAETEGAERTGSDVIENQLTKAERKKLRQAQAQQSVLYEYVISDSSTRIGEIDAYLRANDTVADLASGSNTYSNALLFYVKGRKFLVFVQNEVQLLVLDVKKQ